MNDRPGYDRLKDWLRERGSVLLAYSGGVDSALLARACLDAIPGGVAAFMADLPYLSSRQRGMALEAAEALGLPLAIAPVSWEEMGRANDNDGERCYECKSLVYSIGRSIADDLGAAHILDGENADDRAGDRPGRRAAAEHGVLSPLRELGIGREEVERLVVELGIPVRVEKETCLATRLRGVPLDAALLRRLERGEAAIRSVCELRELRLRLHGGAHVIQVREEDMPVLLERREAVLLALRDAGIGDASLSLEPYRSHR